MAGWKPIRAWQMSITTSNATVRYCSRYTHGVDEKRRVQIPAKWRLPQSETELSLILWENNGNAGACLRVYPPEQFDALMQKIKLMSTSDPTAVALRRNLAKNCENVAMDKSGRICIPEEMAAKAGIQTDQPAVLAGALEWFEIWNATRYQSVDVSDDALSPESVKHI